MSGGKDRALPATPDRAVVNGASEAVSALRASVPSAGNIPHGDYCYASLSEMDDRGLMKINGMCPYWERREGEHAYCRFLDYETQYGRELLWDQVKVCGVNDG